MASICTLAALACSCVCAGHAAQVPGFGVASIKPSAREAGRDARGQIIFGPRRVSGRNVSVLALIGEAYHVEPYRVSGPGWLDAREFDIDARADGPSTQEELRLMLQDLLAGRFHLALHREIKESRVYALVVDKHGPKLGPQPAPPGAWMFHGGMRRLAAVISVQLSIPAISDPTRPAIASGPPVPVLDETGRTDTYDIPVDLKPETGGDIMVSWQRLLQDHGLKLESRKADLEFLVIDRVDRVPAAN